ncbi:MAG TPA: tetratricopeptide repeat protein [Planctomycetaceae bacterium]|jgi:tetratricopeptide (TPR) repeat protein|nr:tetratricopeptide repeat protein [Planctomycetaceae bacterium]
MTCLLPTLRWLPSFAIFCALVSTASAQEVGDEIVVKHDHATLRPEKGAPDAVAKGDILNVLKVQGDRFFARRPQGKKGQIEGWIDRSEVLQLSQGLEAFGDELKRQPTAGAYAIRGAIWAALREYDKALADFDEAVRRDPNQATFYCDRGTAHSYKRQNDQAISDYTEAIRLDPQFATAYVRRAFAWRAKGNFEKAMTDGDEALRINPSFAAGHTARGAVWISRKQYGLAISESSEAIRLDPNFAMAYAGRAYAWQLTLQHAKAIADYHQAIRLDPKTAKTYLNRGMAYGATEDFEQALADYDTAIRLDPKEFMPLVLRAWLTATCPDPRYRDAKKALKDAKRACEMTDWKDGNCFGALAAAYAENGDFLNAVKCQQKAIDLAPENERRQRAVLQSRLNLYKSQQPYHEKRRT